MYIILLYLIDEESLCIKCNFLRQIKDLLYFLVLGAVCVLIWTVQIDVTSYSDHWNRQDRIRIKPLGQGI